MDYFDYYNEFTGVGKNEFSSNHNLNYYSQNKKIKPYRIRNYLHINNNRIENQNHLSSHLFKTNRKYSTILQSNNDLFKSNYLYNKNNGNYNQNTKDFKKYNNNININANFNNDLIRDKYFYSSTNFYPSNKINVYSNDNKYSNNQILTYKSLYDNNNYKLSHKVLNKQNINNNLNHKDNHKIMVNSNSFKQLYLGNSNLNIILNQNKILQNKYKVSTISNSKETEKYINENLKNCNFKVSDNNNKNSLNEIQQNNNLTNIKVNSNKNNSYNKKKNVSKSIKQINNINKEGGDDEINLSELADDLIKIKKKNLSNKKQKHIQKIIPVYKKIITVDTGSQTIPEKSNNIQKKNFENKTEKKDVAIDIQKSLLSISNNMENTQKEDGNSNKDKVKEAKIEHSIIRNMLKKDTIIKETIINKNINNNKINNEKVNEKKSQIISSDKNIEELKNNFSKNESIEIDTQDILNNINLNSNPKDSKADNLVCLISDSSDIDNNINTKKIGKHIKFDLKKNICFQFLIDEIINVCMEVNQQKEIKYINQKNYNQNSKPKKSIIKNFDKNSIKINNNYILCENLEEEDIIPELYLDIEGNELSEDQVKILESTLEMSIEKSFDRSYERSSDRSITQSLNTLISGSISHSYNQANNENSIQDNIQFSNKGKGIINKLNRVFSSDKNEKNDDK